MGSRCVVPPEVISHILLFLSPRQVVRLRVVSKQVHDITYSRVIWTTLYMNAPLPRPPGPFPFQTIQFLERTLVQSEQLAHSWTTQPMEDISSVEIRSHTPMLHSYSSSIVDGRWLICSELSRKRIGKLDVMAYDLEPDAGSHPHWLLWESYMCHICDACRVVSSSGLLVHVLFSPDGDLWKLLEFREDGSSLRHTLTLDIPPTQLIHLDHVEIHGGHSPFSYIRSTFQIWIFDTRTQSFYELPPFSSELVDTCSAPPYVVLTKTHIMAFFVWCSIDSPLPATLVQAFTIPADSRLHNGTGTLRLSHEGLVPDHCLPDSTELIRNSIADAESGDITIRLLHQCIRWNVRDSFHMYCIDLTLPIHSSADSDIVLPMTIDLQDIAHVHFPHCPSTDRQHYIDFSDDGHVRGFYYFPPPCRSSWWFSPSKDYIMRFTIDASRDICVADLGPTLVPPLSQQFEFSDRPRTIKFWKFDGVRGRLYYDRHHTRGADEDVVALVVTIR